MLQFRYSRPAPLLALEKKFARHTEEIQKFQFLKNKFADDAKFEKFKLPESIYEILVIGMGGSSLGLKALSEAIPALPIRFLDNIEPSRISRELELTNFEKTFFIFISKSGETIEVLSLAAIILKKFHNPKNFLIITDNAGNSLGKIAKKYNLRLVKSKSEIPGRFSVLSINGLLPASVAQIQTDELRNGAQTVSWEEAYRLACQQYLQYKKKKNIVVFFPYGERLNTFSDWYIQLMSESIGKSRKVGISVIKAMGVKDQHSQLQLFLDGPPDKFFIFLKEKHPVSDIAIPGKKYSLQDLFNAEYRGVTKAMEKRKCPFVEITFPSFTPEILGELFFFFELEVAYLGSLFGIKTMNQPAVELSKKFTKDIIK